MTTQDSTVANADLWSKYFEDQWRGWLTPLAGPEAARVAAANGARIANVLTMVAAGPVAWLYASSTPKANVAQLRVVERTSSWADVEDGLEEPAA